MTVVPGSPLSGSCSTLRTPSQSSSFVFDAADWLLASGSGRRVHDSRKTCAGVCDRRHCGVLTCNVLVS